MGEEVKTIEQAEEIALKACQALEISVNEKDVKEIEYEKQKGKWEVEIMCGEEEIEVKIRKIDGVILKIERKEKEEKD
ncbi:MAG: hypothetical protein KAH93_04670 [Candidatus Aenigmarchaeota archaeon]|nr:hypothetical protein [Candidatus Aenigmarchaeota archaeon]